MSINRALEFQNKMSINQSVYEIHIYLPGSQHIDLHKTAANVSRPPKHKAKYTTDLQLGRKLSGGASLVACEGCQRERQ